MLVDLYSAGRIMARDGNADVRGPPPDQLLRRFRFPQTTFRLTDCAKFMPAGQKLDASELVWWEAHGEWNVPEDGEYHLHFRVGTGQDWYGALYMNRERIAEGNSGELKVVRVSTKKGFRDLTIRAVGRNDDGPPASTKAPYSLNIIGPRDSEAKPLVLLIEALP